VIDLERDGDVWVLRMRAGENRFSMDVLDRLNSALDHVEAADGPRALVTTGDGKFYSNGLDLDWLASEPDRAGEYLAAVYRLLGRMLGFPALTVAAVNGHAFGAGALLAAAHDIAVMREDRGYWCMPEADLGLPLSAQLLSVLTAKLPARAVQQAVMTGRRFGGPEAVAAGIVHESAAAAEVLPSAVTIAAGLAAKDRRTVAEHKRLLYGDVIAGLSAG
jgi:enoyl-CoA hydratase/carnithine racemase